MTFKIECDRFIGKICGFVRCLTRYQWKRKEALRHTKFAISLGTRPMISTQNNTCEKTLLANARLGNEEAFSALVLRHQDRLFNSITYAFGCAAEAEDIVQEAFVRAYQNLHSFRGDCAFYTWLYRIASNLMIKQLRRKKYTVSLDARIEDAGFDPVGRTEAPSDRIERGEDGATVQKALMRLPFRFRQILLLREVDQCDYVTIAQVLDIQVGTVRSRLHRARQQLRKEYAVCCDP